jgi:hypothetical protein
MLMFGTYPFLQHRQAETTVSHLCVEGGGHVDEMRL